jgi:hypothetical protein
MYCDLEIYWEGSVIALLDGETDFVEPFIKTVREITSAKIDWHRFEGIARVLCLVDSKEEWDTVFKTLLSEYDKLPDSQKDLVDKELRIMRTHPNYPEVD